MSAGVNGNGKPHKRVLTGNVVSDKSDQTIVVAISRRKVHRLYRKYITHHQEADGGTIRTMRAGWAIWCAWSRAGR